MASSVWMAAHPELLNGKRYKAVAALTVEHMGCMEWNDNSDHSAYGPTGLYDPAYCYTTTNTMRSAYLQAAEHHQHADVLQRADRRLLR